MNEEILVKIKALQSVMQRKFPGHAYTTIITMWQDEDFQIEVQNTIKTAIGSKRRSFYTSKYDTEIEYSEIIK